MTGTVPGQELAAFGGVLAAGLLLAFLFFWLCATVGVKQTVGYFTAGLWPRWRRRQKRRGQSGGTADDHSDATSPRA
jgi:hypothetical protein